MKDYWFKAKEYGWGWYPAKKEGWVVTLLWIGLVFATVYHSLKSGDSYELFIFKTIVLAVLLFVICWKTGEPPRWRWGGKDVFSKKK